MTARTRLTFLQLDGRDLPSTVAVTVERPAEYATSPIEWQRGFDQAVQESLQGISVNTTVPLATAEVAENIAAAGARPYTPAEQDELIELDRQIREIDKQLADIEAVRRGLVKQQDDFRALLTTLQNDYNEALDAMIASTATFDRFVANNPNWENDPDPNVREEGGRLYDAMWEAKGKALGIYQSMQRAETLIANIQQRLGELSDQATTLRDIRALLGRRFNEIVAAARENRPSDPRPFIPAVPPLLVIDAVFLDTTRPLS